jgi:hypothetical protein
VTGPRPDDQSPVEPERPVEEDGVQEADEESFPASDPPAAWSGPGGG